MKKLFFLSAAAVLLTATVDAQITQTSLKGEVNYQSKQAFAFDFPDVTVTSTGRMGGFDKFTFTKDGQTISAFYDWDSELLGITQNKTFADLPVRAQKIIGEKYAEYQPTDVLFYDDNEQNDLDMILYGLPANKDGYFVELQKDTKKIVVQVDMDGEVLYYDRLK